MDEKKNMDKPLKGIHDYMTRLNDLMEEALQEASEEKEENEPGKDE